MATNNAVDVGLSGSTGSGNFVGSNTPTLITPLLGTPTSGTLTNCTGLPASTGIAAAAGAGAVVQVLQGQLTTSLDLTNTSFADITGLTIAITPSAATSKILVRAIVQIDNDVGGNVSFFQLARGGTAIGIGTSVGSRQACGSAAFTVLTSGMITMAMEWLDSPATTSSTTYSVQNLCQNTAHVYINRTATDTDSAVFPRTASSITVMEIK